MKKQIIFSLVMLWGFLLVGCTAEKPPQSQETHAPDGAVSQNSETPPPVQKGSLGKVEISFPFARQAGVASNQFAVWIEDKEGTLVKTLFVTDFTAQGGYHSRKEALAAWVQRSNPAGAPAGDIDEVSGATPPSGNLTYTWDCADQNGNPVSGGEYRFFVEGTLFWESNVLYSGTIAVGETQESPVTATAEYSSEDEKNKDMIGPVEAVYLP